MVGGTIVMKQQDIARCRSLDPRIETGIWEYAPGRWTSHQGDDRAQAILEGRIPLNQARADERRARKQSREIARSVAD